MAHTRKQRQVRMSRNGISIRDIGNGRTHVICRRHRLGASQIAINLPTDSVAVAIDQALDTVPPNATRNERVAVVIDALRGLSQ